MPFPILSYYNARGSKIGVTYRVYLGSKIVAIAQPLLTLQADGTVTVPINFKPAKGKTYTLTMVAQRQGRPQGAAGRRAAPEPVAPASEEGVRPAAAV